MGAFGSDRCIFCDGRLVGCSGKFGDGALWDRFQRWWREVTRVTGVEHAPVPWLVNNVQPRAELVFARERIYEIEPATEVDGELVERFPFILQIETVEVTVLVVVINDPPRRRAGLVAIGVDRKNPRDGIDGGVLFGENETAAERVFIVELVAR